MIKRRTGGWRISSSAAWVRSKAALGSYPPSSASRPDRARSARAPWRFVPATMASTSSRPKCAHRVDGASRRRPVLQVGRAGVGPPARGADLFRQRLQDLFAPRHQAERPRLPWRTAGRSPIPVPLLAPTTSATLPSSAPPPLATGGAPGSSHDLLHTFVVDLRGRGRVPGGPRRNRRRPAQKAP